MSEKVITFFTPAALREAIGLKRNTCRLIVAEENEEGGTIKMLYCADEQTYDQCRCSPPVHIPELAKIYDTYNGCLFRNTDANTRVNVRESSPINSLLGK